MTDDQLIAEVLRGNRSRYAELVARHQRTLLQYLWNLAPNRHDCEELAQEALLRAFRHLSGFDSSRSCFRTWLLTIARNLAFNFSAKQRPQPMSELPEAPTHDGEPSRNLEQREWFKQLDVALARLPLEQRSAFVLIEIQQLSYADAAEVEGVPLGTIKSRVSRAKQLIRESFTSRAQND